MKNASRGVFLSCVAIAVLAASSRAHAQTEAPEAGFGDKGHFAIAAERLFGYVHVSQDETNMGTKMTTTNTSISLLGSALSGFNIMSVYTFPRVGFDAFIAPSISIGGSATYFHASTSITNVNTTFSGFLLAPRLGFAVRVAPSVWIWPRAGVSYFHLSSGFGSGGSSGTAYLLAATVEAPVAITLGPQAVVLIGPTADIGLAGSSGSNSTAGVPNTSNDIKETDIGLQVSFVFYL